MRSAITPIVTLLGLDIGVLLAGNAILTESVFNIPGVGKDVVDGDRASSDLPVIQGIVLFGAFFIVIFNLIVDIALRLPRPEGAVPMSAGLLEVDDLQVQFDTDDGVVKAVDGVSLRRSSRGETLGIVGESGSRQERRQHDDPRPHPGAERRDLRARSCSRARDLIELDDEELRTVRGNEIAMIFQDPLTSLHPFYKVGDQIVEAIQAHRDVSEARRARARDRAARAGRDPRARSGASATTRTSSPAGCASGR